jgi:MYXO-CTERM domain-containing protein
MKTVAAIAIVGTASLIASADAGFLGFVGSVRNVGGNTVVDVFAGVSNASDKFLNVYNTVSDGVFVQKAGNATKTWKPDTTLFTSTRNTLDDSFMTAGSARFAGDSEIYASGKTNADPNFTGTSWDGAPGSPAATTIPNLAGWYTGDPTSPDNNAESLAGITGRQNLSGGATANFGIWCAHFVVAGENAVINFSAFTSIKDGVTGGTSQAQSSGAFNAIPAPGAIALLGLASFASRRRRA